jgi:hypothetical protein
MQLRATAQNKEWLTMGGLNTCAHDRVYKKLKNLPHSERLFSLTLKN